MNKRTERSPVGVGIGEGGLVNFLTNLKSIFVSISITAVFTAMVLVVGGIGRR